MELKKDSSVQQQGHGFTALGACAVLMVAVNFFAAFTIGPAASDTIQSGQSRINAKVVAALEKKVQATGIKINGKVEVVLKDKNEAQQVFKQLQENLFGEYNNKTQVDVKYNETIEMVPVEVSAAELSNVEDAVGLLKKGRVETVTYTVQQDENLWLIARKNDMRVREIRAANPGLTTDFVDVGQVINLVKPEPLVHMVATIENTIKEEIPYKTKTEQVKSLRRGVEEVRQTGKKGKKLVTYRTVMVNGVETERKVLAQKVVNDPVTEIIAQGTKGRTRVLTASRGEDGSGKLLWPIHGPINSPYGERDGRRHTGIDIGGSTGESVRAAAGGRVISAGWDGAYGKLIAIESDGVVTRYAHLSSINVSVGDTVGRGEHIGDVGSTGHSTGPHLHFEVLKGGSFRNPMGYLR